VTLFVILMPGINHQNFVWPANDTKFPVFLRFSKPMCLSEFWGYPKDPLYWLSFIEIGEMACSRLAWCTHGHTLKCLTSVDSLMSNNFFIAILVIQTSLSR